MAIIQNRLALRALRISVCFFSICTSSCFGQEQQVIFDGPLKPDSQQHYYVQEFLEEGVSIPKSGDCNCGGFGFFFFRLNKGRIDSLFMEGTLIQPIRGQIEQNIRRSQKFWRQMKGNKSIPTWVVYTYFDLGGVSLESPSCDSVQRATQKRLFEFAESMDTMSIFFTKRGNISLIPSKIGGPYIDL